jgi:hypothetical protein
MLDLEKRPRTNLVGMALVRPPPNFGECLRRWLQFPIFFIFYFYVKFFFFHLVSKENGIAR